MTPSRSASRKKATAPPAVEAPTPPIGVETAGPPRKTRLAAALILALGTLIYGWLFFQIPVHREWLTYPLIADVILLSTFGGEQREFTLLDRLPAISIACAVLASGWGVGALFLRALGLHQQLWPRERVAFAVFAGLALVSQWTLLVGWLIGLNSEWLVVGPPLLVAMIGVGGEAAEFLHRRKVAPSLSAKGDDGDGPARAAWWWGLPFALILAFGAILPPWEFDVLEYHLQVPKEWHQQGRVSFLPHNIYGNMPLGAETHALFAMMIASGDQSWWLGALAGKWVTGCLAIIAALGISAAASRLGTTASGAVAGALYLATPWVVHTSLAGLIDSVLGGYLFLAAYAVWQGVQGAQGGKTRGEPAESGDDSVKGLNWTQLTRWGFLASLLAGGAAACKYPGVIYGVIPVVAWMGTQVAWNTRPSTWLNGRSCGLAVILAAGVFLGGGLWYIKNTVVAGNPVYPLLYRVFGGPTRTPEKDAQWRRVHQPPEPASGAALWKAVAQIGWRSTWQNPLLIPLAVAGMVLSPARKRLLPWLAWIVWGLFVWWLATHRIDRFWVPLLPFAALVASQGISPLLELCGRRIVWGAIAIGLSWLWLVDISPGGPDELLSNNRFFVSLQTLREASTPPAHAQLNALVPKEGKVLLIGDARPFYLERACIYATCFDDDPLARFLQAENREARLQTLHAAGITHVYIDWSEIARYRSPGNYGFSDFVTPGLIHRELVGKQRILKPLPWEGSGELFEVER
jgi:hypothetical protein